MRRRLAPGVFLAGVLLLSIHAWAAIAETATPEQVVRHTADEILAVLREPELPLEERRERIRTIAEERFDTETISRLVLARHWRRFSPDQRERFAEEMKRHLIVNYGDRIDRYGQEDVEILGQRPEARGDVTVRTRITGGEADGVAVDYRLRRRGETWLVIDVVVEGVSVLKSYRSQFQKILSSSSPDDLLEQLRTRNDEAAARRSGGGAASPEPESRSAESESEDSARRAPAASRALPS